MNFVDKTMLDRYEQILFFSKEEMERRWDLARQVMRECGAEALVVLEGSYEGYNHWFMGNRHCECIILKPTGPIIAVIGDGLDQSLKYRADRPVDYDKLAVLKPIWPVHSDIRYVHSFNAEDLRLDDSNVPKRLGFIHPEVLRYDWWLQMNKTLGDFELFDMGMALDSVRVVKSKEEQFLIRQVNHMNEKLMAAVPQVVRPGRTLKEITDEMQYMAMCLGSGGHFVHVFCLNCGPQDAPSVDTMERMPYPGYRVCQGDKLFMLIETNGPGGHYSALGRYCILGEPSLEMIKYWDMAVKAQRNAARMMKPGVTLREIADANRLYIEGCGFKTNEQNYLHSLGFQYGEQPYLNAPSENVPLRAGMHYIAHPVIQRSYPGWDAALEDGIFALDTYWITEGGGVRANDFPQELIILPH